jgi:hypothetical protein
VQFPAPCQTRSQSLVWSKRAQNHRHYVFERNKFLLLYVGNSITTFNRIRRHRETKHSYLMPFKSYCRLQTPWSPDLNPWDYYSWGTLKDRVYVNLYSLQKLKDNIHRETVNIPTQQFHCQEIFSKDVRPTQNLEVGIFETLPWNMAKLNCSG